MEMKVTEKLLRDVIRSELSESPRVCRIPISDEQATQIGTIIEELTDNGAINLAAVVRDTQDNHKWLKKQRMRGERLSAIVAYTVIVGFVSGLCAAVWKGFTIIIKEG